MNIKQELLETYQNEKLIYPFPGSKGFDKFVFSYVMDELSGEKRHKDHILKIEAKTDEISTGKILSKMDSNDKVQCFTYAYNEYKGEPKTHYLTIYTDDENFLLACQLVNNDERLLQQLVK